MAITEEELKARQEMYKARRAAAEAERAERRAERAARKVELDAVTDPRELSVRDRNHRRNSIQKGEQRKAGHALAKANTDGMTELEKLNVVDGLLIEKISNEAIIVANESCFQMLSEEQQKQHKFRTTNLKDLLSIEKQIRELSKRLEDDQSYKLGSAMNMSDETLSALEDAKKTLSEMGIDINTDADFEEVQ